MGDAVSAIVVSTSPLRVELGGFETELTVPDHETLSPGDETFVLVEDLFLADGKLAIEATRSGSDFVRALLAANVPAVRLGKVFIMRATRIDGVRTKVALASSLPDFDPIRACVGERGELIRKVVEALGGERIDLVPYDADPVRFVCNALAPAAIKRVLVDDQAKVMEVIVDDADIGSLASEDRAQIRLAATLTGWRLEVASETEQEQKLRTLRDQLLGFPGVTDEIVHTLFARGFTQLRLIANSDPAALAADTQISPQAAKVVVDAANVRLGG